MKNLPNHETEGPPEAAHQKPKREGSAAPAEDFDFDFAMPDFDTDATAMAFDSKTAVQRFFFELAARQWEIISQRLENEAPSQMSGVDIPSARVLAKRIADEICREMQVANFEAGGRPVELPKPAE